MSAVYYESLLLRPAYEELATYLVTENPLTVDPRTVYAASLQADYSRLVALLYANNMGDTLDEAEINLLAVLAFCARGRRPRSMPELGLVAS